jgi:exportin-1
MGCLASSSDADVPWQDMACETFLKICQRCKHQFVKHQQQEQGPFIDQLLIGSSTVADIGSTIADLEPHQVNMFYEAVGYIVSAEHVPQRRDDIIRELFKLPNTRWMEIIAAAMANPALLQEQETMRHIAKILQINVRVASSLGPSYMLQLATIYERMLQVYKMYSEAISAAVATNPLSAKTSGVRLMRAVKVGELHTTWAFLFPFFVVLFGFDCIFCFGWCVHILAFSFE